MEKRVDPLSPNVSKTDPNTASPTSTTTSTTSDNRVYTTFYVVQTFTDPVSEPNITWTSYVYDSSLVSTSIISTYKTTEAGTDAASSQVIITYAELIPSIPSSALKPTTTPTGTATGGQPAPLSTGAAASTSHSSTSTIQSTSSITTSSVVTSTTPSPPATHTTSSKSSTTASGANSTSSGATSSVSPSTSGISSGAVAGAAIGGLVVGALIAALLVCIFMRRKQKKQKRERLFHEKRLGGSNNSSSRSNTDPSAAPLIGAGAGAAGAGAAGLAGVAAWERHLPQSEADSTIRNAVQATLTQIDLHVDNYYRDAHVPMTPELQSELMGLKLDAHLPDSIIGLLPQTRSPTQLIKHCLAQLVVSRTSLDEGGEPKESFLPPDFTALSSAIGREKANSSKPAFSPALSKHRVLTNYLRPTPRTDRAYLSHRDNRIAAAADSFGSAFAPWAKPSHPPDARRAHLISVMKAAADTGIMLFAQPSTFRYVWDMPKRDEGRAAGAGSRGDGAGAGALRVVVLPGFVKVGDEGAKVLERPQQLVEPVVGSLT